MARTKKPTGKQVAARRTGKYPALPADPVAPSPSGTIVGRPSVTKLPAKTAPPPIPDKAKRAKPPPPPKPGAKSRAQTVDPAVLRAALDAVLANPADDDARAAYATALRESGDPRGDFIAVGLQLAMRGDRTEQEDPPSKVLWGLFRDLHQRNSAKWTKGVKALGKQTRWRWHRGFIHELRLNGWEAGCTPGNLTAVLASEPVAELAIEGCDPELLARLLAVPGIERVRRLAVSSWDPAEGGGFIGRVIGKATRLTSVVELRIGIKVNDAGILPLLDATALGKIEHLALGAPAASTETFAALAASPLGQRLEVLEVLRERITPELAKVIATMPCLRRFVASHGHVDPARELLAKRFRDQLVVEEEHGMGYLIDGIRGVTHRPQPKR